MLHDALELCTEGPSLIRFSKTAPPEPDARRLRLGPVGPPGPRGHRVRSASSASARCSAAALRGGRAAGRADGTSVTVWDPRIVKPLDMEMLHDAARHDLVVTIEDGLRDGGAGSMIADALRDLAPAGGPSVRVLGVPSAYLPTASPTTSWPSSASTPTACSARSTPGRPRRHAAVPDDPSSQRERAR